MTEKRGQNNKGFTLVELLVAMMVLAIVCAPLLHVFVTAARTNAKAKEIMRATTASQNALETIKSMSIEDLSRSVNGFTKDESGNEIVDYDVPSESFEAVYDAVNNKYTSVDTASVEAVGDSTTDASFVGTSNADGSFYFVLPDNGGYDVIYEFTPVASKVKENVTINSMNRSDCVYFAQSDSQVSQASSIFAQANVAYKASHSSASDVSAAQFEESMTRTITLELTRSESGTSVNASLTWNYDCGSGKTASADRYYQFNESSSKDSDSGTLSAVYIYYYPLYRNGSVVRDKFVIKNPSSIDTDVYLIAMEDANGTTFNKLNYKASIDITEGYIAGEYSGENKRTSLHTTLCSNLEEAKFEIQDHNTAVVTGVKSLGNKEEETYMYTVVVKMYKHNSDALTSETVDEKTVYTYDASKSELLTSFEGSVRDASE